MQTGGLCHPQATLGASACAPSTNASGERGEVSGRLKSALLASFRVGVTTEVELYVYVLVPERELYVLESV